MNKISIGWGFLGIGICICWIVDRIRSKKLINEAISSGYNLAHSSVSIIEELTDYMYDRYDDLSDYERERLEEMKEAIEKAKGHLSRGEHGY